MSKQAVVCDTSVLLYLGRIDQIDLLTALFKLVYITEEVSLELDAGRLLRVDTVNPRLVDWMTLVAVKQADIDNLPSNRLGAGERSVIAYACTHPNCIAGIDDYHARLLAGKMGLRIVGTVGILLRAKKNGLISAVKEQLVMAQEEGFRLSNDLYDEALLLAGEK